MLDVDLQMRLNNARLLLLGAREERTPLIPTRKCDAQGKVSIPHVWEGGTAFERDLEAPPGVKGSRCQTIAQSHQHARSLIGPAATVKRRDVVPPLNEIERRHKAFLSVSALAFSY